MMDDECATRPHQEIQPLSLEEKKYLLAVERGDVAGTLRYLYILSICIYKKIKINAVKIIK